MTPSTDLPVPPRRRRSFSVALPEATYSELTQIAERSNRTPAAVVQEALDLLKLAGDESFRGHVLAIATRDGKLLKQVIIPE